MTEQNTIVLDVKGMTCQGCVNAVTSILKRKDPDALVSVDMGGGLVTAETCAQAIELAEALTAGGYETKVAGAQL
jgi:copper chaperone